MISRLLLLILVLSAGILPAWAEEVPRFIPDVTRLSHLRGQWEQVAGECMLFDPTHPVSATDRFLKESLENEIVLYVPRGDDQDGPSGLIRTLTVHFNRSDRENAQRSTRLLARLVTLHRERFGHSPIYGRNRDEGHVWLTTKRSWVMAESGGETRDNNIYIYSTDVPRTLLEWTRTVAHEWGHLTLLAARGYAAPENDAAGYLGERLYMRWLRETEAAETGNDGTSRSDLNLYNKRQILPLIERFLTLKAGPRDARLYTMDGSAMDLYIGAVLSTDAAWGSPVVSDALFRVSDTTPRAFFAALRETLRQKNLKPQTPCWNWTKSGWVYFSPPKAARR